MWYNIMWSGPCPTPSTWHHLDLQDLPLKTNALLPAIVLRMNLDSFGFSKSLTLRHLPATRYLQPWTLSGNDCPGKTLSRHCGPENIRFLSWIWKELNISWSRWSSPQRRPRGRRCWGSARAILPSCLWKTYPDDNILVVMMICL